jgi:predicted lipoprotein with Yx(FWY)xxD motif
MNKQIFNTLLKNPVWKLGLVMAFVLILSACQSANTPTQAGVSPTTTTASAVMPASGSSEAVINVVDDPKLGKILVGANGMTLYMFTKDGPDQSNCTGKCLTQWPPLLTQGKPTLGAGVDASLVGTATLADGTMIVTYNKMPLYYWYKDTKAGDTTGQGVGSVWFVVSPDGMSVGNEAASIASPTATLSPTATPGNTGDSYSTGSNEATLNVVTDLQLGKILVGNNGMTLYIYTKDGPDQSNCTGGCLAKWPPLLTQGNPKLGEGVDASLVGTATLADGSMIVTYNKMPLYYWANDSKPGDTTGQGVGSVWYVISPDGKVNTDVPGSMGSSSSSGVSEATINVVNDAKLGKILVDGKGMTLYIYTKDGPDQSNCTGDCLTKWPPLITQGNPTLGDGVDSSLIGTATLADGSKIVTYNKMPLYYWYKDTKAGDATGQGVGSVWFVVSPDGQPVGQ